MGVRFNFEHANFMGYLLSPSSSSAPRARLDALNEFFTELSWSGSSADYGVSAFAGHAFRTAHPLEGPRTLSADPDWLNGLRRTAAACQHLAETLPKELSSESQPLPSMWVEILLSPLRPFFTGYSLSALVVPRHFHRAPAARDERSTAFFEEAAMTSGQYGIFVMPDRAEVPITILDPFPQVAALAEIPVDPPLVAFWSPNGAACVLPLNEARDFYHNRLRPVLSKGPTAVSSAIALRDRDIERHRIVHLSDLHFGETRSNLKRRYVQAHLRQTIAKNDLVVLTGDQIDTPERPHSDEFIEFRDEIQSLTEKEIVAIPGNHDVRRAGNRIPVLSPPKYELITDIRWERIVVDREIGCILLNFNSLEEGIFARGSISNDQLLRMAVELEEKINRERAQGNAAVNEYLKVALVHHHPYTYVTRPTAWYDKIVRKIFRSEDKFIRFDNADRFINWCVDRRVSLILHGHKHVPHHIRATIDLPSGQHEMMVVSCGSTMGAEESPLCYDVIYLNRNTKRWNVVFYQASSVSGSRFEKQAIEIDYR